MKRHEAGKLAREIRAASDGWTFEIVQRWGDVDDEDYVDYDMKLRRRDPRTGQTEVASVNGYQPWEDLKQWLAQIQAHIQQLPDRDA
jgi:hypothetical protein